MKTRPPSVSTVMYFPETVIPKAAKAGGTMRARATKTVCSNMIKRALNE